MQELVFDKTALWTIAVAAAANAACAIVGCFLVLRRMSLLGDAISHAVLPGIAIAYLLTGALSSWPIALGALVLGILTAVLTQTLHVWGKVPEDASMGVVFTSLFALGVIIIENWARDAHIDAGCALYGRVEYVPLETTVIAGFEAPRTALTLGVVLCITVGLVVAFWKELRLASFDPQLANSMGFSAPVIHYGLMGLVATVTVASFEAVGSILVVAMLIVPGATAHLLTDRLIVMLPVAAAIGVLSAVMGYIGDVLWQSNVAGTSAVAVGLLFAITLILAPKHGLLSKWIHNFLLGVRIAAEDLIGRLYRQEEAATPGMEPPSPQAFAIKRWLAARWLRWQGKIAMTSLGEFELTETGRDAARSLIRAHRLWESYLDQTFELPADHLHEPAERIEHFIGPQLQREIAEELRGSASDPHGREIPNPPASDG